MKTANLEYPLFLIKYGDIVRKKFDKISYFILKLRHLRNIFKYLFQKPLTKNDKLGFIITLIRKKQYIKFYLGKIY